jgi:predicted Zn finger-like uncharacterized protein
MIVTCEKCNTSFDLDDDLIQESGSEVKCSECEHVFTVYKPAPVEEPAPSPELEGDAADFPQAEEPAEEEFEIEALGLEEETEAEGLTEIEEEAVPEEIPAPVEEAAAEELDLEGIGLEEKPEAEGPVETEVEAAAGETPGSVEETAVEGLDLEAISRAVEEAAEEPETVAEEAPEEEVLDFDLLEAEEEPAEKEVDFEELGLDEEPVAEEPAPVEEEAAVEEAVVEEAEVKEEPEVQPVEEEAMPPPVTETAPPPRKRTSAPVMIVLVLVLLAGGAFGAYVLLKDRIPFLQSLTGAPKPAVVEPGNLHITLLDQQITTEFVENSASGRVFVIKGMVRNDYPEARNFIRVEGVLYSQDGKAVQKKTSYCGNVLSCKP